MSISLARQHASARPLVEGLVRGYGNEQGHPVRPLKEQRFAHTHFAGKRLGKTTTLINCGRNYVDAGEEMSFVDFCGQPSEEIRKRIPLTRLFRHRFPAGAKLFRTFPHERRARVAEAAAGIGRSIWDHGKSPTLV